MIFYFQVFYHFLFLKGQHENEKNCHKKMIKYGIFGLVTD
jgi:hypothetical protein